jgi:hypothetical protein
MARSVEKKHGAGVVFLSVLGLLVIFGLAVSLPFIVRGVSDSVSDTRAIKLGSAGAQSPSPSTRVVPSHVTIENKVLGLRGAGAIVGDHGDYIIASAHLLIQLDLEKRVVDKVSPLDALEVTIRSRLQQKLQTRRVESAWIHKAFSSGVGSEKLLDVAVLKLEIPFEQVADRNAAGYWQPSALAPSLDYQRHGKHLNFAVYGAVEDISGVIRPDLHDPLTLSEQLVVLCGNEHEELVNNNTFCVASMSNDNVQGCSGDTGGPLIATHTNILVGIVSSTARNAYCIGEPSPHRWAIAASIAKLRPWLEAIFEGHPFAATEVLLGSQLRDTDIEVDDFSDTGVFCSAEGGVFRVDVLDYQFKHCSTGRIYQPPHRQSLKPCNKPCVLRRVRTTSPSLVDEDEQSLAVTCRGNIPYRLVSERKRERENVLCCVCF